jgi:sialic acid synthase SpsE
MKKIQLSTCAVGSDEPCIIIVDAGVNHNNIPERAFQLIKTAAKRGANIVKFQTYTADTITTRTAPRYWDPRLDTDGGGTQYDTFKRLDKLPKETYKEMIKLCREEGVIFCSTPFDIKSAEFLEGLGVEIFKISSSDITYHQLIKAVSETKKPVILSTGTASIAEIEEAIDIILKTGNDKIILQHCILSYPCKVEDANLNKMIKLMEVFSEFPVGYSDHTEGFLVPFAAVALNARTIEKHYTIDKRLPDSPDHSFSLDPDDLTKLVNGIRKIEKSLGTFVDGHYPAEEKAYYYARKSVVATIDISKDKVIRKSMLTCKRPGTGISPKYLDTVVGKRAKIDIGKDTTITWDMIY